MQFGAFCIWIYSQINSNLTCKTHWISYKLDSGSGCFFQVSDLSLAMDRFIVTNVNDHDNNHDNNRAQRFKIRMHGIFSKRWRTKPSSLRWKGICSYSYRWNFDMSYLHKRSKFLSLTLNAENPVVEVHDQKSKYFTMVYLGPWLWLQRVLAKWVLGKRLILNEFW